MKFKILFLRDKIIAFHRMRRWQAIKDIYLDRGGAVAQYINW